MVITQIKDWIDYYKWGNKVWLSQNLEAHVVVRLVPMSLDEWHGRLANEAVSCPKSKEVEIFCII